MLATVIFDRYSVDAQLDQGDGYTVYQGTDTRSSQRVRILALPTKLGPTAELLPRLEAAAKKLSTLPPGLHPAWLKTGEAGGQALIVTAAAEGPSLASRIASAALSPEQVVELAHGLGKFLEALHQHDLLQGLFDPQEIVFPAEDRPPLVTNPALAACLDLPGLLAARTLPERPACAPELLDGKPVSPLSDLYSLGAILFEALTGKPVPRPDLSPNRTMIVTWLPSRLRRDIPPALDELVATCLNPDPAQRYSSLQAFLAAVNDQRAQTLPSPSMIGMEDSLVGQTLGAYRLVERLGQGGMATVYKAYEPALNRYVAIKVLPQFFANDPNFSSRFRREAKAVAKLNHPNIVPIYSFGESNGITYIAMQFVQGGTLKHERGDKLDYQSALKLLLPITRALHYAHQNGIVHRDVKPSNVLLGEDGWPLLADFGLARMAEGSSEKLTGTGVGMGTPMYMSPEQGQGVNVDHRSDIYSLGIMLYEFVTGDVPFRADTPMAIVIKHMTAPLPIPRSLDPSIPETVENIILKAAAKDPADRFQSAKEMADAMEAVLLGTAVLPPAPAPRPTAAAAEPAPAARPKPSGGRKAGRWILFSILGILGFCLLAVILMGVFDLCPPQGPWPQPPWCEGSPFQFSWSGPFRPTDTPAPTPTFEAPPGGYDPFGSLLLQDDFDGSMLARWRFTCDPNTTPWTLEEIDGRTVFHSQPPSPPGDVSCAEYRDTDWQDYTVEYDFKLAQPDQFGSFYYSFEGRIADCPPNFQSIQVYGFNIMESGIQLYKSTCVPASQRQLTEVARPIEPQVWHRVQIMLHGNNIQLWLDGEQWLDYTDEDEPLLQNGDLWFFTRDSAEVLLDNLKVYQAEPMGAGSASVQPTSLPTLDPSMLAYGNAIQMAIENRTPDIRDTFDTDRGWQGFYATDGSAVSLSVQDGVLQAMDDAVPGGIHMSTEAMTGLQKFAVKVEASFLPAGTAVRDRAIGICWWPGDSLGYRFLLYEDGSYEAGICQGEECPVFAAGNLERIAAGEVVTLTLLFGEGESGVYVNGVPLAYQDLQVQEPQGGFSLCPHEFDGQPSGIVYDNLQVWNLDMIPNLP